MNTKEVPLKILEIEARVKLLEAATGISGPWLTPAQAAKILPIGRDRILSEIQAAEQKRSARQTADLMYGIHYFNTSDAGDRHSWKIHCTEFWAIVQKPAEERKC
jgi:hypothetical protein